MPPQRHVVLHVSESDKLPGSRQARKHPPFRAALSGIGIPADPVSRTDSHRTGQPISVPIRANEKLGRGNDTVIAFE